MSDVMVAIDIGNTTCHAGVTRYGWPPNWMATCEFPTARPAAADICGQLPAETATWCLASVHRPCQEQLIGQITELRPADHIQVLRHDDLPLRIDVAHPDRVGMDRLVAALAAYRLSPSGRPAIVVDAGTAITVDLVSGDGVFRGGTIMPGWRMSTNALAAGTDLLPQVNLEFSRYPEVIGKSTEQAIESGVFWGTLGAIREIVTRLAAESDAELFLTGGDMERFLPLLERQARFVPELVLAGIVAAQTPGA